MLQLILKDFRANWMYQSFSLVVLFAISTGSMYILIEEKGKTDPDMVLYVLIVVFSSAIVSLLFMIIDKVSKTDELFLSLPVARKQIVIAKYINSFVLFTLALLVHFSGATLGAYIQGNMNYPGMKIFYNPTLWLLIGTTLILINGFSFPFYFKFGLRKGAMIVIITEFLLLVLVFFGILMLGLSNYIVPTWNWLSAQSSLIVLIGIIILSLFIFGSSVSLSTKIYKNKDI